VQDHLALLDESQDDGTSRTTALLTDPILPPLTPEDTSVFPSPAVNTFIGFISPWIDLCSPNRIIASISRQVLNLELNYANFCGIKSLVISGPASDASKNGGNQGLAQFSRAVQEALTIGSRLTFLIHMPMYREPGLETMETLSSLRPTAATQESPAEIDLFSSWDSWHHIRSVCTYDMRLFVGRFQNMIAEAAPVVLLMLLLSPPHTQSHAREGPPGQMVC
jgi:type II protein arginine methyltransferase